MSQTAPIVIVGAGLAGWSTARELRKLDAGRPVVLVSADSADFYAKPTLSNALAQKRGPDALVTKAGAEMAGSLRVRLHANTRVTSLDPAGRTVQCRDEGGEPMTLPYERLVLATGARPIEVPLAAPRDAVIAVNCLDDYRLLHGRLAGGPKRVLLMGAGLIGCEFANDLAGAGHHVSVVDPSTRPLAALLPPAAGDALQGALEGLGVTWHFGSTVRNLAPALECGVTATLSGGAVLEADVVVSAVGLHADTSLAQAAGLQCERGIVVDEYLESSIAGIHALGDAAQYRFAGNRVLPYVMPIMQAARSLASTLAGQRTAVQFPLMPVSVKTPAMPVIVAPPPPGAVGEWVRLDDGGGLAWRFVTEGGQPVGFALLGAQTARRVEMVRSTVPAVASHS